MQTVGIRRSIVKGRKEHRDMRLKRESRKRSKDEKKGLHERERTEAESE